MNISNGVPTSKPKNNEIKAGAGSSGIRDAFLWGSLEIS
jgi:hypothetical protein